MYEILQNIEKFLASFPTLIAVASLIAVILGWTYTSSKNRTLQRRRLAISLLYDHRFNDLWIKYSKLLYDQFIKYPDYNWKDLVEKRFQDPFNITPQEQKLFSAATMILNTYEFMSVAMLDKTVDEKIIKEARKTVFELNYKMLHDYISEIRIAYADEEGNENKSIYLNFETIVNKWSKLTLGEKIFKWLSEKVKLKVKPTAPRM